MIARFVCPYCRASLDPAAMDIGCNERIDLRICPVCDTPVLLGQNDMRAGGFACEPCATEGLNRRMVLESSA
jgi:uncharacterized protein YbaR (Trm112 family)